MTLSELIMANKVSIYNLDQNGQFTVRYHHDVSLGTPDKYEQVCSFDKGEEVIVNLDNLRIISASNNSKSFPMKLIRHIHLELYPMYEDTFQSITQFNVVKIILPKYDYQLNPLLNDLDLGTCKRFLYTFDKLEVSYADKQSCRFKSIYDSGVLTEYLKIFCENPMISHAEIKTPLLEDGAIVKENYPKGIYISFTTLDSEVENIFNDVLEELKQTFEIRLPDESAGIPDFIVEINNRIVTDL